MHLSICLPHHQLSVSRSPQLHLQQQCCLFATTATRMQNLHSMPDDMKHTTASLKPDQFDRASKISSGLRLTLAAEKPEVR